jgi:hypothetical protein
MCLLFRTCLCFSCASNSILASATTPPATSSSSLATAAHHESQQMPTIATTTTSSVENGDCIKNFRPAAGLNNVYRCAKTDGLGDRLGASDLSKAEQLVLYQAGLIVDLRSKVERDEEKARTWMSQYTISGESFTVLENKFALPEDPKAPRRRTVLRLDPLSPTEFMQYLEDNWLSPSQTLQMAMYKMVDGKKLHHLRMDVLNEKGLVGLNEAILETGQNEMLAALQAMTLHLETNPSDTIVIHCVQGKDRTGLLVMLCQSILGVSDDEIISDYHRSEAAMSTSAALQHVVSSQRGGKLDKVKFGGAPSEVMETTLSWLRSKYGSVSPGYLDAIGFDDSWRRRFAAALLPSCYL